MLVSNYWKDYECIDAGNGEKLERWKDIVLRRPDPWALWTHEDSKDWNNYHAIYHRSDKGGGYWENRRKFNEFWTVNYKDLTFKVSPTGFKHTGLFPEQAVNWDWMMNKIKSEKREIKVLNLFAYTGDAKWADRLEVLAFNALPATISDDMWTHQYDQMSNQIACIKFPGKPIFRTNGQESHLFGLEPNYGCCTANFNQAWPKLALSTFMHRDGAVF